MTSSLQLREQWRRAHVEELQVGEDRGRKDRMEGLPVSMSPLIKWKKYITNILQLRKKIVRN